MFEVKHIITVPKLIVLKLFCMQMTEIQLRVAQVEEKRNNFFM